MTIETKPTWAGTCEASLVVQSSELDLVFSMLAIHGQRCGKKHWVETYSQFLSRIEEERLRLERKTKQREALKNRESRIESWSPRKGLFYFVVVSASWLGEPLWVSLTQSWHWQNLAQPLPRQVLPVLLVASVIVTGRGVVGQTRMLKWQDYKSDPPHFRNIREKNKYL